MNYAIFFSVAVEATAIQYVFLPNTINNRLRIISSATTIKLHHFHFHVYDFCTYMQFSWNSSLLYWPNRMANYMCVFVWISTLWCVVYRAVFDRECFSRRFGNKLKKKKNWFNKNVVFCFLQSIVNKLFRSSHRWIMNKFTLILRGILQIYCFVVLSNSFMAHIGLPIQSTLKKKERAHTHPV